MCVTEDPGSNTNEAATNHSCDPFFGALTSSTTRAGKATVTEVDIAGVVCRHQGTSITDLIEGGFGIEGQDTDPAATGWGTLIGTFDKSSHVFALKFKGSLTP
jgi:hypothetical protein